MDVNLYATKIQAEVLRTREESESAYDRLPDQPLFFGFVDLAGSSNYRIINGPKKGYVRGETFFALIRTVIQSCIEVRLVKEIGDEVFLSSNTIRTLLESLLLIEQTAVQLAGVAGEERFPFDVRAAIGFGTIKRMVREHDDFLGKPIDQLARVMSVRSGKSNLLLHEDAYRNAKDILGEYSDFLSVSESMSIPQDKLKGMVEHVYYRELLVDRKKLISFREHFVSWR